MQRAFPLCARVFVRRLGRDRYGRAIAQTTHCSRDMCASTCTAQIMRNLASAFSGQRLPLRVMREPLADSDAKRRPKVSEDAWRKTGAVETHPAKPGTVTELEGRS
ncbi:MAG: hypothetical protein KatS3mg077_1339 [Candidatus Binatia bacterium]|nr:MAG: hypothetical protein KatS3mg077_1339 [Candidatus Binatia bacterium]